ncbi:MAG TPA: AlpA family transcriptional regulator [Rhodocyclaceae bacterium]|nr:AlpA family transcriptional regulator [Rhodocyclaceae bacterium]
MKVIRLPKVIDTTGLARSTIYKLMSHGAFPNSIPLGARSVGWIEAEIITWIQSRANQRDQFLDSSS